MKSNDCYARSVVNSSSIKIVILSFAFYSDWYSQILPHTYIINEKNKIKERQKEREENWLFRSMNFFPTLMLSQTQF